MTQSSLETTVRTLAREAGQLRLRTPSHVYNPLLYAWTAHREYLRRYGAARGRVLLLGMNPGPWGMAQTGVPFGDVAMVREWFGIETRLGRVLPTQHPKYPILGMACARNEGSGSRLWRWASERLGSPDEFFARFFVWNYCPLLFIKDGRNLTPEHLNRHERDALTALCDRALADVVRALAPTAVVGIGRYAQQRATEVLGADADVRYLLHPSPANPKANREWPALAEQALEPWLPQRPRRAHRRSAARPGTPSSLAGM
ncbi:MAG TPA: uracil-DNA glycosylase family protein [Gemmatimonadaceae bacterium]|nr:uracil-DNA glycosylase family protein [Gemmatimonadaceae bacterium]